MTNLVCFIFQSQIFFSNFEEYTANKTVVLSQLISFLSHLAPGLRVQPEEKIMNKGEKKKLVLNETIALLNEFYKPHNQALASLLGDDKWLFRKT